MKSIALVLLMLCAGNAAYADGRVDLQAGDAITVNGTLVTCENSGVSNGREYILDTYCTCTGGNSSNTSTDRRIEKVILFNTGRELRRPIGASMYATFEHCSATARNYPECQQN